MCIVLLMFGDLLFYSFCEFHYLRFLRVVCLLLILSSKHAGLIGCVLDG